MALSFVPCPICGTEQPELVRYPDYLCRDCAARVTDADARPLTLVNTSDSGGVAARYADSGELAEEPSVTRIVYVDGVRCHVSESRVGGIVVQPQPEETS